MSKEGCGSKASDTRWLATYLGLSAARVNTRWLAGKSSSVVARSVVGSGGNRIVAQKQSMGNWTKTKNTMLDQQQRLDHGHKLNNAKMKMILRRHKWVVGQWRTSGFFFGLMLYLFLVRSFPTLCFFQHNKPEKVSWLLLGGMGLLRSVITEYIDILLLCCSTTMRTRPGGSWVSMAPSGMMKKLPSWMSYVKFELTALDRGW